MWHAIYELLLPPSEVLMGLTVPLTRMQLKELGREEVALGL